MSLNQDYISLVVPRRGINDEGRGKKHALYRLISAAETPYVWLQDDDVLMPHDISSDPSWLRRLLEEMDSDLIILPLRMESESDTPTLLERLQIAEYAAIQQLTIEYARHGKAVMCSGANMIVRRDRWLESYPEIHPEIASGDDMFLLESFKRRGLRINVCEDRLCEAIIRPHTSWKALMKQRMRWAGKAPKYTDKEILRCGAIVLIANILQIVCPLVLFLKFPIEYHLIKKRDASVPLSVAMLLAVVYPWYMLVCIIGGLFRRQW